MNLLKPKPLSRGIFHLLACLFFPALALFTPIPMTLILISLGMITIIFVSLDLLRFRFPRLAGWAFRNFSIFLRSTEKSKLTGASYLLIASLISFLVFPRDITIMSLFFLGIGDSLASIIGSTIGRRKIFTTKTLEGTLACFAGCVIAGLVLLHFGNSIRLTVVIVGSIVATLVELLPLRINDNLLIPLCAGTVMFAIQSIIV
ncbi:MAG: hypothetical protein V1767_01770 [Chloroflexota bacterium]